MSDTSQQPARYRRYLHDDGYFYEVQPLGPARRVGHPGYGMEPETSSLAYPQEKRLFDKRKAEWEEVQRRRAAKASSKPGVSGQLSAVPPPEPENDRSLQDRQERQERLRALQEKYRLQKPAAPVPPPPEPENDDNAKVARRQEELAGQLLIAIASAGEGGWRSPFYTGAAYTLSSHQVTAYARWKDARDSWTATGDEKHLQAVRDAVDFTCPPEAPVAVAEVPAAGTVWYRQVSLMQRSFLLVTVYTVIFLLSLVLL